MALTYRADWERAKNDYVALTKEHKPKEKTLGIMKTGHTGLHKTLEKACDYTDVKKQKVQKAKEFAKLTEAFAKEADSYITLLEKTLKEEKPDANAPKTDKYRGLKMLKTKLESYKVGFKLEHQRISEDEQKIGQMEQFGTQIRASLEKNFSAYKAAEKTIKAAASVAIYDRDMQNAARCITTALGQYKLIEQNYKQRKVEPVNSLKQNFVDAEKFVALLTPWASGDKATLSAKATSADVLAALKEATTIVKACAQTFNIGY
ncbi:MAG: hypothetical protein JST16_05040 [Bdellovibrionales bacterium]|nr:hypothetical protein [Bdellovibrionales bacterium]